MKILLVEDNERVAQFVRKGLAEEGHIIDHADNGRDGLYLAATGRYDVMILDRMLPGGGSMAWVLSKPCAGQTTRLRS
jgi:two-component system OmpR family response regulator